VAPRFVHKSVHKTRRPIASTGADTRRRDAVLRPSAGGDWWAGNRSSWSRNPPFVAQIDQWIECRRGRKSRSDVIVNA
jgi:hypothetical protein